MPGIAGIVTLSQGAETREGTLLRGDPKGDEPGRTGWFDYRNSLAFTSISNYSLGHSCDTSPFHEMGQKGDGVEDQKKSVDY